MNDPFNQLPTPPEFIRKLDAAALRAKEILGCPVVLIAAQENGKMAVSIEGIEDGSSLDNVVKSIGVPGLLLGLSVVCTAMDERGKAGPQS
jgi:2-keto-3-deoxy-L-rhamnonate aldolase RhmA